MKARDVQKVLAAIAETIGGSLDHMAGRFAKGADELGEEFEHLAGFSKAWTKLPDEARTLFVQQFLKSSALVLAGNVAAKAGLKLAKSSRKDISKALLVVADFVEPVAKKSLAAGKAKAKKAKKKLEKSGK